MKHIILKICIVLSCILNFSQTIAQVKTKIYPDGLPNKKLINNYSFNEIRVAAPANFETLKQNAADPKYLSEFKNKFAETINVDYDIIKLAKESKADIATVLLELISKVVS